MTTSATEPLSPVLKWPGGKRWLAPFLSDVLRKHLVGRYIEPFLGAGAVFLALRPKESILSDINGDLIEFLVTLRQSPEEVLAAAWRMKNDEGNYYKVRKSKPRTDIGRAARFLFLNRTCWGGIYRLNRKGNFNVPFGRSGRGICSRGDLLRMAAAFQGATLRTCDFEKTIEDSKKGDVVYADPPYTTKGQNNGFVRYNERLFAWSDQERLSTAARRAARRGALVCVSGLWHHDLLALYPKWWAVKLHRTSCVSRLTDARGGVEEVLLFSRKPNIPRGYLESAERVLG